MPDMNWVIGIYLGSVIQQLREGFFVDMPSLRRMYDSLLDIDLRILTLMKIEKKAQNAEMKFFRMNDVHRLYTEKNMSFL